MIAFSELLGLLFLGGCWFLCLDRAVWLGDAESLEDWRSDRVDLFNEAADCGDRSHRVHDAVDFGDNHASGGRDVLLRHVAGMCDDFVGFLACMDDECRNVRLDGAHGVSTHGADALGSRLHQRENGTGGVRGDCSSCAVDDYFAKVERIGCFGVHKGLGSPDGAPGVVNGPSDRLDAVVHSPSDCFDAIVDGAVDGLDAVVDLVGGVRGRAGAARGGVRDAVLGELGHVGVDLGGNGFGGIDGFLLERH